MLLSAYREDEEFWRIRRLADLCSLICRWPFAERIDELNDHKGRLLVKHRGLNALEGQHITEIWEVVYNESLIEFEPPLLPAHEGDYVISSIHKPF